MINSKKINEKAKIESEVKILAETGLDPVKIAEFLQQKDYVKLLEDLEGVHVEDFPDEIKVIAQALAFRWGNREDFPTIWKLLQISYHPEVEGPEAFRNAMAMELEVIKDVFVDSSYQWLIVEAPNGQEIEEDGIILGVCCFSTDGTSKKNGIVEGKLGTIRFLGVLPRYLGLCVGLRLLERVEREMVKQSCCRVMMCVPSPRTSMERWIERKGYHKVNRVSFPSSLSSYLLKSHVDTQLLIFVKSLDENKESNEGSSITKLVSRDIEIPNVD